MNAKLVAVNRGGPHREFLVSETVLRIGSHPGCRVRLPEIEPHAVTLEVRDERFVAHNKTQRELTLEGQALAPEGRCEWPVGARLFLRCDLALALVEDAPATTRRRNQLSQWPQPPTEGTPAAEVVVGPRGGRSWIELGVTVLCVAASIGLLALSSSGTSSKARLTRLITELREDGLEGQRVSRELQLAAQAEFTGQDDESHARYKRLRDQLIEHARPDQLERRRDPLMEEALAIVSAKLMLD